MHEYWGTLSVSETLGQKYVQHSLMEQRETLKSSFLTVSICEKTGTRGRDWSWPFNQSVDKLRLDLKSPVCRTCQFAQIWSLRSLQDSSDKYFCALTLCQAQCSDQGSSRKQTQCDVALKGLIFWRGIPFFLPDMTMHTLVPLGHDPFIHPHYLRKY